MAALVGGCGGGSGPTRSGEAAHTQSTLRVTPPAAPRARTPSNRSRATAVPQSRAIEARAPGVASAPGSLVPPPSLSHSPGRREFDVRLRRICAQANASAVGSPGATRPGAGSGPGADLGRMLALQRVIAALSQRRPPMALRGQVAALVRDLELLEQLSAAPVPGSPGSATSREHIVRATEARIRREALLAGLPNCAPGSPPGVPLAAVR